MVLKFAAATMAAKTVMNPPALCAYSPHFCATIPFPSVKSYLPSLTLPVLQLSPRFGIDCKYESKTDNVAVSLRRLSIRATKQVNNSGSIDFSLMQSMEKKIKEDLRAESVTVKDAYGDGRHVSIDVIASTFEGQSEVNRQRMVYKAIWEELQSIVHAVDEMTTRTPAEAESEK